jgi:hypothetical protein
VGRSGQAEAAQQQYCRPDFKLWWQIDPRDQRPFRAPDVPAEMKFVDYATDGDPVLNAIFKPGP